MGTLKQKKVAEELVNNMKLDAPKPVKQVLAKVGYSPGLAKHPKRVIESVGVQEELEVLGFTEEAAKGVVASIMANSENDMARLKAGDMIFKVIGSYAAEKVVTVDITPKEESSEDIDAIVAEAEEKFKKKLSE